MMYERNIHQFLASYRFIAYGIAVVLTQVVPLDEPEDPFKRNGIQIDFEAPQKLQGLSDIAQLQLWRTAPAKAERELEEVTTTLKSNVQEVRELIHGLRPLALDQLGLVGALRQHVEQFGQQNGIEASVSASDDAPLDPLTEITVFRIVQECLINVQKHANATQVEVSIRWKSSSLEVLVRDDGRGFDPSSLAPGTEGAGMGLLSMKERAKLLGGDLSIHSSPDGGCDISLHVPPQEVEVGAD